MEKEKLEKELNLQKATEKKECLAEKIMKVRGPVTVLLQKNFQN